METITYPRRGRKLEEAITQDTLDHLMACVELWLQGPGVVGGLQLHSCWGKTSVLGRRYQGQTVSEYYHMMSAVRQLVDRTGSARWKLFADEVIHNILFLQEPDGGFRHASAEFEPTFHSGSSCPIHQNLPVLTLLDYAAWDRADPALRPLIRSTVDRHAEWFQRTFWLRGNGGHHPLPYAAGYCGVTNQDLVVVAAMTAYGRLYGDWSRYEQFGKPTLDLYLSEQYYYPRMGLFERGVGVIFAERTPYYSIILSMLGRIFKDTGDERIPPVIENVSRHLFDAVYTAPDGLLHLAWGAVTDPEDKSRVKDWRKTPVTFDGYSGILLAMQDYLQAHPDAEKQAILDSLRSTYAAYVYSDGSIPGALWGQNPTLTITTCPPRIVDRHLAFVVETLGDRIQEPRPVREICLLRRYGEYTWRQRGKLWSIEKNGERVYGGYTAYAFGVTHGPEETPLFGSYDSLKEADVEEVVETF